jgi:hypothetical protein
MPAAIAGNMLVSVLNPDGTLVGAGGGSGNVVVTNTPLPVSGTVTANAGTGTFTVAGTVTAQTGSVTSTTTLNAVTGNATGTVADFGSAKTNISVIAQGTGTLAGALSFKISHNNTLFVEAASIPITAAGVVTAVIPAGARYARVDLTGATGTGTITATLMGA